MTYIELWQISTCAQKSSCLKSKYLSRQEAIYSSVGIKLIDSANMSGIRLLLEKILQLPADSSFSPSYVLANENKVEQKVATVSVA